MALMYSSHFLMPSTSCARTNGAAKVSPNPMISLLPLLAFLTSSLLSHRGRALFPLGQDKKFRPRGKVTEKNPPKQLKHTFFFPTQAQVCDSLPSIDEMKQYTDEGALKAYLDGIYHAFLSILCFKTLFSTELNPLCYPLLRWILMSNRAHLAPLPKNKVKNNLLLLSPHFIYLSIDLF